jgi:catechol 2,3-dioxygenase-like lactoylglutathione lyase family enzyme
VIIMTTTFRSARDIIIRTDHWAEAVSFYASTLGFSEMHRSENMLGFETGAFRLYVEKGEAHGPVFEYLVPDVQEAKQKLLGAGCILVEEDASVPRCYVRDPYGLTFNIGQADAI